MGVQLPYNENAEKVVLGAALLSEKSAGYVMTSVIEDHFFVKRHKTIFEAMRHLFDSRKPIDTTTLVDELLNSNNAKKPQSSPTLRLSYAVKTAFGNHRSAW